MTVAELISKLGQLVAGGVSGSTEICVTMEDYRDHEVDGHFAATRHWDISEVESGNPLSAAEQKLSRKSPNSSSLPHIVLSGNSDTGYTFYRNDEDWDSHNMDEQEEYEDEEEEEEEVD